MRAFVEISLTGNISGAKKLDVYGLETGYPLRVPPVEVMRTLNGTTTQSYGVGKRVWEFSTMLYYGDTRTNYATKDFIDSLFGPPPTNGILFRDWLDATTVRSVVLLNVADGGKNLELKSPTADDPQSLYIVKFNLQEV